MAHDAGRWHAMLFVSLRITCSALADATLVQIDGRLTEDGLPELDRTVAGLIFRGDLPFFRGYAMAVFLESKQVHRWDLRRFLIEQAERLKTHASRMADAGGPAV